MVLVNQVHATLKYIFISGGFVLLVLIFKRDETYRSAENLTCTTFTYFQWGGAFSGLDDKIHTHWDCHWKVARQMATWPGQAYDGTLPVTKP